MAWLKKKKKKGRAKHKVLSADSSVRASIWNFRSEMLVPLSEDKKELQR
jgi:hypothetical protein